ncbi:MAG: hypothetical protein H0V39_08475 [Nitrosomonas sp.]|nr:hypothetical protein [Nitrosomonas sp.]
MILNLLNSYWKQWWIVSVFIFVAFTFNLNVVHARTISYPGTLAGCSPSGGEQLYTGATCSEGLKIFFNPRLISCTPDTITEGTYQFVSCDVTDPYGQNPTGEFEPYIEVYRSNMYAFYNCPYG